MNDAQLIAHALEARKNAWVPYSHFAVGAALLCDDGALYCGCNIENAAYSPGNCAERTAFFKAISEGQRSFAAIAVAGGACNCLPTEYVFPCGVCRQVMQEFCRPDFRVIVAIDPRRFDSWQLHTLLPHSFGREQLVHQEEG